MAEDSDSDSDPYADLDSEDSKDWGVQAEQKKEKEKERWPGEHGRREQWRGAKAAERAFRRPRPPPPGAGGPGLAAQVGFGPWSFQK
jgi:hypothetical protein